MSGEDEHTRATTAEARGRRQFVTSAILILIGVAVPTAAWIWITPPVRIDGIRALRSETEIRRSSKRLVRRITATRNPDPKDVEALEFLMLRLREGWPDFRVSHYYPVRFTSQRLLVLVYGDVARAVTLAEGDCRAKFIEVLRATRPREEDPEGLHQGYAHAIGRLPID